jgi:hypothetical protein
MTSFAKTWISETLLLVCLAVPVFAGGCERQNDPPVVPKSLVGDARAGDASGGTGPQREPAAQSPAAPPTDASLTRQVRAALKDDPAMKGQQIEVDTKDAEVTLTGTLDRQAQVTHAVDVARSIEGVRDVVNRLTVKGEDKAAHTTQG